MRNKASPESPLHHRQVEIEDISIHVVEGGTPEKPAVLFLHGWPESWATFEQIMIPLSKDGHAVAIDLPGVGASEIPPPANDKRTLAKYVHGLITRLGLQNVTLVGHDIGGQIVIVPADTPHKFVNSGTGSLRQIDIHPSSRMITTWLQD